MGRSNELSNIFNVMRGLSVGYEDVFRDFEYQTKFIGYPPHNIYRIESKESTTDEFVIELAVAGFKKDEIKIQEHQGEVTISGLKKVPEAKDDIGSDSYRHRGIATRNFTKSFKIAEYYEITDAKLEDGMLTVTFVKNVPESAQPKFIPIK